MKEVGVKGAEMEGRRIVCERKWEKEGKEGGGVAAKPEDKGKE